MTQSMLLHVLPNQSPVQVQLYVLPMSSQLPPLAHGLPWQSSTSEQVAPRHPSAQAHEKLCVPVSLQVPPLLQGLGLQSSTSLSQWSPDHPGAPVQSHVKVLSPSTQVPPFLHASLFRQSSVGEQAAPE